VGGGGDSVGGVSAGGVSAGEVSAGGVSIGGFSGGTPGVAVVGAAGSGDWVVLPPTPVSLLRSLQAASRATATSGTRTFVFMGCSFVDATLRRELRAGEPSFIGNVGISPTAWRRWIENFAGDAASNSKAPGGGAPSGRQLGHFGLARQLPLQDLTPSSNKGHTMKKASYLIVAGAGTALLSLAAVAQTPPQEPAQQSQGASFESLDTNSDGRISKAEAEANAGVKAQFSSYDVNGDGFIERAEVNQANSPRSETPQQ
jgi:hypothetical protein